MPTFLEDQKRIIRHIIRKYARDRTVFYTSFDTPGVFDAELEELLGETKLIYEIIFDQTSGNTLSVQTGLIATTGATDVSCALKLSLPNHPLDSLFKRQVSPLESQNHRKWSRQDLRQPQWS